MTEFVFFQIAAILVIQNSDVVCIVGAWFPDLFSWQKYLGGIITYCEIYHVTILSKLIDASAVCYIA